MCGMRGHPFHIVTDIKIQETPGLSEKKKISIRPIKSSIFRKVSCTDDRTPSPWSSTGSKWLLSTILFLQAAVLEP